MSAVNHEGHPSRNAGRAILFALVIAITLGVVSVAARMRIAFRQRHLTLPDGSQVELLPFTTEKPWHRFAKRFLPHRFQNWIPSPVSMSYGHGSNCLTIYLRITTPTGAPLTGFNAGGCYATEDKTGFRYAPVGGWRGGGGPPGSRIYELPLQAYPRCQRDFLFHLVDTRGSPLGNLRVPNPVREPFPNWRPLPLPQPQTNGPVTLTLKGLEETGDISFRYIEPKWQISATSHAWVRAHVRQYSFLDPAGNEGPTLSRSEPVWKLRALVSRGYREDFPPDEQMILTNLSIPKPGNFISLDQSGNCAGTRIKVLVLAGAGEFGMTNYTGRFMKAVMSSGHSILADGNYRIETWGSQQPFLLVEADPLQPDDEIKFRVFDNEGRVATVNSHRSEDGPNGTLIYKPSFIPPPGALSVTVQIIVSRPLLFEFVINPAEVRTAKP